MGINLRGNFLCSKYAIPHMIENGGGAIVNCSSISGHVGQRKQGAYNAAKGAIELLTKCMALDFAEHKIRVNSVCPAWIEIDFNREDPQATRRRNRRHAPHRQGGDARGRCLPPRCISPPTSPRGLREHLLVVDVGLYRAIKT